MFLEIDDGNRAPGEIAAAGSRVGVYFALLPCGRRGGDPVEQSRDEAAELPSTRVVWVDFGISFNHTEDDDLTRVNEEVGNRFLRLPEHAPRGSSPVSDVTQLAGLVLWVLTGVEPRALQDEAASYRINDRLPEPSWKRRSPDRRCADS